MISSTYSSNRQISTDLLIIGGGINGVGIAADAAGRGLSVTVCEGDDLASGTSSYSSKLIHGGLRYLQYGDLKLVRESLREREILLRSAPYLVYPRAFVIPIGHQPQPAWLIRLGLWLYDHLAKRDQLPSSRRVSLRDTIYGEPLSTSLTQGFRYFDCQTDDARLVILNAIAAHKHGAQILTYTHPQTIQRGNRTWHITLFNRLTAQTTTVEARCLINAAGPWVMSVADQLGITLPQHIQLVKGSHLLIKKPYSGDHAYLLPQPDRRVVFMIPYLSDYLLIGTTDVPFLTTELKQTPPQSIQISDQEIDYLCNAVNRYLKKPITPDDILWQYAGLRALIDNRAANASALTRDYQLCLDQTGAPVLSVLGGKLTTYRPLAEAVLHKLRPYFPNMGPAWTAETHLPGGDLSTTETLSHLCKQRYPELPISLCQRFTEQYGTRLYQLLEGVTHLADLGKAFSTQLYQREVDFLIKTEWARTTDDVLWRRTKLGLSMKADEIKALDRYMKSVCEITV